MENRMELGSEFNISFDALTLKKDNLVRFFKDYRTSWFEYGRSAVRSINIDYSGYVMLPEFICESVIRCFLPDRLIFYRIDNNFDIDMDDLESKLNDSVKTIYVVHYFGYVQRYESMLRIRELAGKCGIMVIEDTTQSLFSLTDISGDYAVASMRKWMGVHQGGVLYTAKPVLMPEGNIPSSRSCTKAYGMVLKDMFLRKGYDFNSIYRDIFERSEHAIDEDDKVYGISDFAYFIIQCQDVPNLITKRKENAAMLAEGLKKAGVDVIREFGADECPFAFPLRVSGRDSFRKYLMDNRIYCAVHWPFYDFMKEERKEAEHNSQTLISLPIDQRYGREEIEYMIKVISNYGGKLSF